MEAPNRKRPDSEFAICGFALKPVTDDSVQTIMSQDAGSNDFLTHLQARFGIDAPAALALLADWIGNYEPVQRREIEHSSAGELARREPDWPRRAPLRRVA